MDKTSVLNLSKELQEKTRKSREEVEQLTSKELQTLARNLSEQSQHGLNTISKDISQSLQNHKTHLKSTIAENESDITKAIASHKSEITKQATLTYSQLLQGMKKIEEESTRSATATRRSLKVHAWMWPLVTLLICLGICVALWGTTLLLGKMIESQARELLETNQNLRQARGQLKTYGIEVTENEQGRFLVLPKGTTATAGWNVGDQEAVKLSLK